MLDRVKGAGSLKLFKWIWRQGQLACTGKASSLFSVSRLFKRETWSRKTTCRWSCVSSVTVWSVNLGLWKGIAKGEKLLQQSSSPYLHRNFKHNISTHRNSTPNATATASTATAAKVLKAAEFITEATSVTASVMGPKNIYSLYGAVPFWPNYGSMGSQVGGSGSGSSSSSVVHNLLL